MNEQQAQALAQRIQVHLPHIEVQVKKSCDLHDWIEAAYAGQDAKLGYVRPAHEDDGTWGCRIEVPGENPIRASTRIARVYFDELDWESYVNTYEPLIHRFLEHTRCMHATNAHPRTRFSTLYPPKGDVEDACSDSSCTRCRPGAR